MARGKPPGDAPKPVRSSTPRNKQHEKEQPAVPVNPGPAGEAERDTPNPEWWRGDPGKRGEVL